MKRNLTLGALTAAALLSATPTFAAKPCLDADRDGYLPVSCGGNDCNDKDAAINPGAAEVCGDSIDNNCSGTADESCSTGTGHAGLTWSGYAMCRSCHPQQASDVFGSSHYQWMGSAPYNVNNTNVKQGKLTNSINAYCVNILGNWDGINASRAGACSNCHVGLGLVPSATSSTTQLDNIDCLMCHQDAYKRKFDSLTGKFVPDTAAMSISMDVAVQTLHKPTRVSCLRCHAGAGGADAVKRGDLAVANGTTSDGNYDVHMAKSRADLACQACHTVQNHRIAGSGTDLRVVDLDVQMKCSQCHTTKETATGHVTAAINTHVARVACQSCHIPQYGRNASDTAASEATETFRTWRSTDATVAPFHPARTVANNVTPRYAFWNGYSNVGLLGDTPAKDAATGAYPLARPVGGINDAASKLYPFKYKTAEQPFATNRGKLIAIDTKVFFSTANSTSAVQSGLVNMGYTSSEPFSWVLADTYQLLNHTVAPAASVVACTSCHENTSRMNLPALGYARKAELTVICTQCHSIKTYRGLTANHDRHVTSKGYDCSWCHTFSRPERGLILPR
jgi:hypothetical protein